MKIKNYLKKKKEKGFTLIESLVAITVLLISVVAPLTLAQQGIRAARMAQSQIVAFYLAQEGLELVKNLRDQNRLSSSGNYLFNNFPNSCFPTKTTGGPPDVDTGTGCVVYTNSMGILGVTVNIFETTTADGAELILKDKLYQKKSSSDTEVSLYRRKIQIWHSTASSTNNEAIVRSIISWDFGGMEKTYSVKTNLLNW